MTFEEEVYNAVLDMLEDNRGFAFNKKNLYNQEELLNQQYFISREMFFYHLKKECPESVNYLYYELFPYFKKIYFPYINYYKKSNVKKSYIFEWTRFLYYTSQNANDNLIKFTRKLKDWGNNFNLDKKWVYDAALANMSSWIQSEEHKEDKTWIYSIPTFLNNNKKTNFNIEQIEDEFIKESINIALDNDISFFYKRNKTVSIPAPRPEEEGLKQYRDRIKDVIKERYEEEKIRLKNEGYTKSKKKEVYRIEDHFKWLILSHVKGLKNREIIEMLNENMEESNISHVVNDLKKILGL